MFPDCSYPLICFAVSCVPSCFWHATGMMCWWCSQLLDSHRKSNSVAFRVPKLAEQWLKSASHPPQCKGRQINQITSREVLTTVKWFSIKQAEGTLIPGFSGREVKLVVSNKKAVTKRPLKCLSDTCLKLAIHLPTIPGFCMGHDLSVTLKTAATTLDYLQTSPCVTMRVAQICMYLSALSIGCFSCCSSH